MAYTYEEAMKQIAGLKNDWTNATQSGDTAKAQQAASSAQQYYDFLRKNGYENVADTLSKSDATQAQKYVSDYLGKAGKTAIRPYYYNLGTKYGLSNSDIDKLLSFDETTGNVSFAGKNLGKPDGLVDGASYWDPTKLDQDFNDYISRNGVTRTTEAQYSQGNEQINQKLNQQWGQIKDDKDAMTGRYDKFLDYQYDTNPYESEIGKSIMADYQWQGKQASDNASASGASTNSGNIDSYAAANAARQQLAFTNAGKQAVLNDHNSRIQTIQTTLQNLGVYQSGTYEAQNNNINLDMTQNQRIFDNDQTAKNNQVSRDAATSEVTGYIPANMDVSSNPFFDGNGKLKNESIDYQAIINNANERLKATDDPQERADLRATIRYANRARTYKVANNPQYAQYTDTLVAYGPEETANMRAANADRDSAERVANGQALSAYESAKADAEAKSAQSYYDYLVKQNQLESNERIQNSKNQTELDKIEAQKRADLEKVQNSNGQYTFDANGNVVKSKALVSASDINKWVKDINGYSQEQIGEDAITSTGVNSYKVNSGYGELVTKRIVNNTSLSNEEKMYLLKNVFGISDDVIYTVMNDPHYAR